MVCVVSSKIRAEVSSYPPDGLCGYSSLSPSTKTNVTSWLKASETSAERTLLPGSGADSKEDEVRRLFRLSDQRLSSRLHDAAVRRGNSYGHAVQHAPVGFLNLYREFSTSTVVTNALLVLKRINTYIKRRREGWSPLLVLGLSIDFFDDYDTVDVMRTIFVPSLFIAIGHISYSDASFPDCTILPPNILVYPNSRSSRTNRTYGHTLNDTLPIVERVRKSHPQLPLSISVALSGRYYTPEANGTFERYLPFEKCVEGRGPRFDDPAQICPNVVLAQWKLQKNDSYFYESLVNERLRLTFTFDSLEWLKAKLCEVKRFLTTVSFGVAAYDVEYDSLQQGCPQDPASSWCLQPSLRSSTAE
ncbi:hypothetical protein HPB51_028428 [Rhipicephalus microplus]|uniref:Uncharacterized protein n=1 Tax=Rhipicephalus microplus TaxID=6941 RepID=A0A9J6CWW8_RHIMP|nr:hypothetical protein HPB51_028428 [Rhipicephalus microplus]